MAYRRYPSARKFPNTTPAHSANDHPESSAPGVHDIPLPNEREPASIPVESRGASLLDFFKKRISFDEIILLGLIFLLLEEGLEDDFLLIILLFLLISGRR